MTLSCIIVVSSTFEIGIDDSGKDGHNKLHSLYRGDRLSRNVFVKRFPIKVLCRHQKLKMRGRRSVVPELASNAGVACHSREHTVELKGLKWYAQTNECLEY